MHHIGYLIVIEEPMLPTYLRACPLRGEICIQASVHYGHRWGGGLGGIQVLVQHLRGVRAGNWMRWQPERTKVKMRPSRRWE